MKTNEKPLLRRKTGRAKTELDAGVEFAMTPCSPFPRHVQTYISSHRSPKLCHKDGIRIDLLKSEENLIDKLLKTQEIYKKRPEIADKKGSFIGRKSIRPLTLLLKPNSSSDSDDIKGKIIEKTQEIPSPNTKILRNWLRRDHSAAQRAGNRSVGVKKSHSIPHFSLPNSPTRPSPPSKVLKLPSRTHSDAVIPYIPSSVTNSISFSPVHKRGKTKGNREYLMRPVLGQASRLHGNRGSWEMERVGSYLTAEGVVSP